MASRAIRTAAAPQQNHPQQNELSAVDGLAQLSFVVQNALARRAGEHGLSVIQTRLLGVLRDREPSMNELAKLLDLDKSSITGLVDRAERRGLVTRVPSAIDRRAVVVGLTGTGRSLATEVAARFAADVGQLLGTLPAAESAMLSASVSRLLVSHAAEHGLDLFAGLVPALPDAGGATAVRHRFANANAPTTDP